MKINDPIHNPFHNRFHVPVHSRLDEMQAHTQVVWLKDPVPNGEAENDPNTRPWLRAVAGAFAIVLVVAFSAAFLSSFLSN